MIIGVLAALHLVGASLLLGLSLWLLIEVLASHGAKTKAAEDIDAGPIAVLIPAHNEGKGLIPTIIDVKAQLRPDDRVIVVADNCDDDTAEIAREYGAEVLVREDRSRRGKGFALQFGLDRLRSAPPSTVFMTDADCLHSEGLICGVSAQAELASAPVQALYLMNAEENAPPSRFVAAFAWAMINDTRMRGLWRLAGATRLVGAGVAFPWSVAGSLSLGSDEIVEDLALTVTLAAQGQKVLFSPEHVVSSTFPDSDEAAEVQRARWEHGSIGVIRQRLGQLVQRSLTSFNPWQMALALDVAIPPLTVMMALLLTSGVIGLGLALMGAFAGLAVALAALSAFGLALVVFWLGRGRTILPLSKIGALLGFLTSKLGVYGKSGRASSAQWTRTPRDGEQP